MFELKGRKALVTGGSQGLGKGMALALGTNGADVAIGYLNRTAKDKAGAELTIREIRALGRQAFQFEGDMTQEADVEKLHAATLRALGRIDIFISSVGGYPNPPIKLVDMSTDDWNRSVDLNLKSAFLCCRAVARTMIDQNYGRIVLLASGSAFRGVEKQTHYSATKAAIVTFGKTMARELGPHGITVNIIAPGRIDSPMTTLGLEKGWWGDYPLSMFPTGRIGKIKDVAAAACFLASEEAEWFTGQTMHVNGGSFMP